MSKSKVLQSASVVHLEASIWKHRFVGDHSLAPRIQRSQIFGDFRSFPGNARNEIATNRRRPLQLPPQQRSMS